MNIKTIAKEAGVSTATVSNVITGKYNKVSAQTIAKVQDIINKNDYKPNAMARSLASKESKIIGVVIPYLGPADLFSSSPYNSQMLSLLENYIRNQGYYMMMRCVGACGDIVSLFSMWNVDGIILLGAFKDEVREIKTRLNVPTIYIDTYAEEYRITSIGADDYRGGYLLGKYLIDKGHRDIAFAGPNIESPGVIKQRYQGFYDACKENDVVVNADTIFEINTTYQNGVIVGSKIANAGIPFTAVACMSDVLAFGVMEGLRIGGKNVPDDISVIGFDNLPECNYSTPRLTSINQNLELKAKLAGEYLFEMIREKKSIPANIKVDVQIVERQSVKERRLP